MINIDICLKAELEAQLEEEAELNQRIFNNLSKIKLGIKSPA